MSRRDFTAIPVVRTADRREFADSFALGGNGCRGGRGHSEVLYERRYRLDELESDPYRADVSEYESSTVQSGRLRNGPAEAAEVSSDLRATVPSERAGAGRKPDLDARTRRYVRAVPRARPVSLRDDLHQVQAESNPRAFLAHRGGAVERLEDAVALPLGDPRAAVANSQDHPGPVLDFGRAIPKSAGLDRG